MTQHYYERNIVEIKNEYLNHLTDTLIPLIYEGLKSIYARALEYYKKLETLTQSNSSTRNPGIIKIFQACLKDIPSLSAHAVEVETTRIKEASRCSEWFDDLIKAVIKSYIVLLTYNASGKTCKLVQDKLHEQVNVPDFIHKIYIECSKILYDNPEVFIMSLEKTSVDKANNTNYKDKTYKYIRQSIIEAIHKSLPIKSILQEYLAHDYIVEQTDKNMKTNVKNYMENQENGYNIIESDHQHSKNSIFENQKKEEDDTGDLSEVFLKNVPLEKDNENNKDDQDGVIVNVTMKQQPNQTTPPNTNEPQVKPNEPNKEPNKLVNDIPIKPVEEPQQFNVKTPPDKDLDQYFGELIEKKV